MYHYKFPKLLYKTQCAETVPKSFFFTPISFISVKLYSLK